MGGVSVLPFCISTMEIIRRVSYEMGVPVDAVMSPCRQRPLVRARAAVAWLTLRFGTSSRCGIGRRLGRHHTSILHLIAKAEKLRLTDPAFRMVTDRILHEGNAQ